MRIIHSGKPDLGIYTSRAIFTLRTNPPWTWRVQWREEEELHWDTPDHTIGSPF